MHPDYDGYTNNCQNFVRRPLIFACHEPISPKTIELAVKSLLVDLKSNITSPTTALVRRLNVTVASTRITENNIAKQVHYGGILAFSLLLNEDNHILKSEVLKGFWISVVLFD
jgi:hypothetical protein